MLDKIQTKVLHYLKYFSQGTKQGLRELPSFRVHASLPLTSLLHLGKWAIPVEMWNCTLKTLLDSCFSLASFFFFFAVLEPTVGLVVGDENFSVP
jgi:hypothetical protein